MNRKEHFRSFWAIFWFLNSLQRDFLVHKNSLASTLYHYPSWVVINRIWSHFSWIQRVQLIFNTGLPHRSNEHIRYYKSRHLNARSYRGNAFDACQERIACSLTITEIPMVGWVVNGWESDRTCLKCALLGACFDCTFEQGDKFVY